MRAAMPHQTAALERYAHSTWAFFAMEMRLGKTLTAIRWVESRAPVPEMVLVVAPVPVLPGWQRELKAEGVECVLLEGSMQKRVATLEEECSNGSDVRWFLTNYESLQLRGGGGNTRRGKRRTVPSVIARYRWGAVVLDESTRIKNPQANVTKIVRRVMADVPVRACLSGLPMPESEADLFEQMAWVRGGRFMGCRTYWDFRDRYYSKDHYTWLPHRDTVSKVRTAFRRCAFVLTRKEAGLAVDPITQRVYTDLPAKQRRAYDKIERTWETEEQRTKWIPVVRVWLAGFAGGRLKGQESQWHDVKLKLLLALLKGDTGHELAQQQVVVWFRFNTELYAAAKMLRAAGVSCRSLSGETDKGMRARTEVDFGRKRFRVLLGQSACGKFGLNLACASVVLWYSHSYSLETTLQAKARTEHPHKKEPTLHVHLLVRSTVDEDVVDALDDKRVTAATFMRNVGAAFRNRWQGKYGKATT